VPCVNALRRDYPDYVEYSNQRIPAHGVSLNLDEEFLTGCDCTDGCRVITRLSVDSDLLNLLSLRSMYFLGELFLIPAEVYGDEIRSALFTEG